MNPNTPSTNHVWSQSGLPAPQSPPPPRNNRSATVAYAVLGTLAVITLTLIGLYVRAMNARSSIPVPNRPVAPSQNGFVLLKAATAKTVHDNEIAGAIARSPKKQWTLAEKKAMIADNHTAITLTQDALRYPYYEENTMRTPAVSFPYYSRFRNMVRILFLAGNVAWEEGKQQEAIDDYLDALTIGRRVPHRTVLLGRLVGVACESMARRALWDHLADCDEGTAVLALKRLEALQQERLPFWETMDEEKFTDLQMAQYTIEHPQNNSDLNKKDKSEQETAEEWRVYSKVMPQKFVLDTLRQYLDQVIAQAKRPYIEDHAVIPAPEGMISTKVPTVFALGRCRYVANETGDALLRAALALRIYHLRNSRYPAKLGDLVTAKIITRIPDDPFALPGTPLQYKPEAGDTYLLYSIGPDGVDDGGKGIENKKPDGTFTRFINYDSKGDVVAGWYTY